MSLRDERSDAPDVGAGQLTAADERYVRVAYGRDYADVTPIKGSYRGAETSALDVDVAVAAAPAQQ